MNVGVCLRSAGIGCGLEPHSDAGMTGGGLGLSAAVAARASSAKGRMGHFIWATLHFAIASCHVARVLAPSRGMRSLLLLLVCSLAGCANSCPCLKKAETP